MILLLVLVPVLCVLVLIGEPTLSRDMAVAAWTALVADISLLILSAIIGTIHRTRWFLSRPW